ncbi:MAG TPA: hypothetical protein VFC18_11990 [Burkholderiales bacterium]|nr:hypothetical protein [Burkholderiales bacterium]
MTTIVKAVLLIAAAALAGCAGTQFKRAEPETLQNGETTYAQVVQRMGEPRSRGQVLKNNKQVTTASYSYAEAGGKSVSDEVIASKTQMFFFADERLVGHAFASTWAEDHTRFDDTKLSQIAKGRTTKEEVIALLGKPSGYYRYPMIDAATGEALVYVYAQVAKKGLMSIGISNKEAVITLDERGVVSDVKFESTSQ